MPPDGATPFPNAALTWISTLPLFSRNPTVAVTTYHQVFEQRSFEGSNMQELAVLETMLKNGPLFERIPFKTIQGSAFTWNLEDELPQVQARLLDEKPDGSRGSSVPQSEILRIYTADIETDKSRIALDGADAHDSQVLRNARSLRMQMETDFVRGSSQTTGGRAMDGLASKIPASSGNSQAIANHATGGPLSLAALDELLAAVDGAPQDKVLIVPRAMQPKWRALARNQSLLGNIDTRINELGRLVTMYGETEIIETDVDPTNSPIQPFNEGSGSNTASIYCVVFGEDTVLGIQGISLDGENNPVEGLAVWDVGESYSTTHIKTRINLHAAMVIKNPRSAARLYNITNAAIVA